MAREIHLTKGLVAIVDDEDFEWLSKFSWHTHISGLIYAARNATAAEVAAGAAKIIYMHSVICPAPDGLITDHANNHTLDNRRGNLRPATHRQNGANTRVTRGAIGYRGVYMSRPSGRFVARLRRNGLHRSLGTYSTPEEAARVYDAAALAEFGEFARLNFPEAA